MSQDNSLLNAFSPVSVVDMAAKNARMPAMIAATP